MEAPAMVLQLFALLYIRALGRIEQRHVSSDGDVPEDKYVDENQHEPMQVELDFLLLSHLSLCKQVATHRFVILHVLEEALN